MPEPRFESGTSGTAVLSSSSWPPRQLNLSIEFKLSDCFNLMGRNINKQSQMCGPHFFKAIIIDYIHTLKSHYKAMLYDVLSDYSKMGTMSYGQGQCPTWRSEIVNSVWLVGSFLSYRHISSSVSNSDKYAQVSNSAITRQYILY